MSKWLQYTGMFLDRNSATILTCLGGVGVITTAVLAIKATPKALQLIEEAKEEKGEELTKLEVVKVAGPSYIPSVIAGVSTVACIFGANVLNKQKQASLMSAYALLDTSFKGYKEKVLDLYGMDADARIKESIAADEYEDNDISLEDDSKELFFDFYSMRYFESTKEEVLQAQYETNRLLNSRDYVTLNEYYDLLGLPHMDGGNEIGWSSGMNYDYYWQSWIDFKNETANLEDGMVCNIISFSTEPFVGFDDY